MKAYTIRKMRQPDDYAAVAPLVNLIWAEPTTAERLREDEEKIPPGKLHYEEGRLMGWDRPKWVAEDETGQVIGYATAWRAPGRNREPCSTRSSFIRTIGEKERVPRCMRPSAGGRPRSRLRAL
ncbi:hypothetical protein N6H14_05325 [Paenibacillus sp. CC-CFT747]|nr:hypothetical protein N6H14_05325 [Paenibacillus sp. CC-CFT747]